MDAGAASQAQVLVLSDAYSSREIRRQTGSRTAAGVFVSVVHGTFTRQDV